MVIKAPWKRDRRRATQGERARVRDLLKIKRDDPDCLVDMDWGPRHPRRAGEDVSLKRGHILKEKKRRVRAELKAKVDVEEFIRDISKSRTLYALIAMGFFRHVLESGEYAEDHRYKLAIVACLHDPSLTRAIKRRWEQFDREFPDPDARHAW
jgi:hypothetical protein